ncbi:MAG: DUF748 domain-containing protein, partial [Desulfobacterota bacterium]|nr:DUF748 domain-containing protein [Thermodesulfobacteriota bacterium]
MKKKLFIAIAILFVLIFLTGAGTLVWVNYFWGETEKKLFIEKELSSILHRPITIQNVYLRIFPRTRLILTQVKVKEQDGSTDFMLLEKFQLSISLPHLFSRVLYFNYLILERPRIFLWRKEKEGFNAQDLWNIFPFQEIRKQKKRRWLREVKISLRRLVIREGEIDFKDWRVPQPPVQFYVVGLTLQTGRPLPSGFIPIFLQFNLKNADQKSKINLRGEILPIIQKSQIKSVLFKGTTGFLNLSLSQFAPYICPGEKIESLRVRGMANGSFNIEGVAGKKFIANGDINITDLNFSLPHPHPEQIKIDKFKLRLSLNQEKGKWEFPLFVLNLPEFSSTGNFRIEKISSSIPIINAKVKIPHLDYREVFPKLPLSLLPERLQKLIKIINAGLIQNLTLTYSETILPNSSKQKRKFLEGNFSFQDFSLKVREDIPPLEQVNGKINFKNREVTISDLTGIFGSSRINKS